MAHLNHHPAPKRPLICLLIHTNCWRFVLRVFASLVMVFLKKATLNGWITREAIWQLLQQVLFINCSVQKIWASQIITAVKKCRQSTQDCWMANLPGGSTMEVTLTRLT